MGFSGRVGRAFAQPAVQAGLLLGGAAGVASFSPSLMPRPGVDQSIVTGGSMLAGFAVGSTAAGLAAGMGRAVARTKLGRIAPMMGVVGVAAAGGAAALAAAPQEGESLRRAGTRTAGIALAAGAGAAAGASILRNGVRLLGQRLPHGAITAPALAGAAVVGAGAAALSHNLANQRAEHGQESSFGTVAKQLGVGLGVAGVVGGLVALERGGAFAVARHIAKVLPGNEQTWRKVGHAAVLGGVATAGGWGVGKVFDRFDQANAKVEPGYEGPAASASVSSGPGSLLEAEGIGRQGRRFVHEVTRAEQIEKLTGEAALEPVRVYVGTDSAATVSERVELAMAELERTGAFERDTIVVASPSGSGFVNPVPIAAAEYMARGNIATVAMQYGSRPSFMSFDNVPLGGSQNRKLLQAIHLRLHAMDPETRPRLVVYGESLGAHTTQDVFIHNGTDGIDALGIDKALWVGTPFRSEWKQEVLTQDREDTTRERIAVVNGMGDVEDLPGSARNAVDYWMLTHNNDPVAHFGYDLLVQKPAWLGSDRPEGIPASQRWIPGVTFLQTMFDTKNSARVVPGRFEADGHDYRADLTEIVREAWEFDHVSDAEASRIEAALIEDERVRAERLAAG